MTMGVPTGPWPWPERRWYPLERCVRPKSAILARKRASTRTLEVLRSLWMIMGTELCKNLMPCATSWSIGGASSSNGRVSFWSRLRREPLSMNSMTSIGSTLLEMTAPMTVTTQGCLSLANMRISWINSRCNCARRPELMEKRLRDIPSRPLKDLKDFRLEDFAEVDSESATKERGRMPSSSTFSSSSLSSKVALEPEEDEEGDTPKAKVLNSLGSLPSSFTSESETIVTTRLSLRECSGSPPTSSGSPRSEFNADRRPTEGVPTVPVPDVSEGCSPPGREGLNIEKPEKPRDRLEGGCAQLGMPGPNRS
mmetsp:Transcript_57257/g.164438  ORF Transcript_57257/g.164438 Transcript_57257/m.164438 type:complete len:310 (+) Transcript_57257:1183-2112(+)